MGASSGPAVDITDTGSLHFAVLVSANAEWGVVKPLFASETIGTSPYGEYFLANVDGERVLFFPGRLGQGGSRWLDQVRD